MSASLWVGLAAAALALLYLSSLRAITVADLEIAHGKVRVLRGGIAPPILADLRDIARTPPIASARVSIVRSGGRAEVKLRGDVHPDQAQRIRNVIGSVPLARLRNAARK